ncbi:hypothetical protein [Actinacidiphila glaucinigra]|uniref:hypothetical protein n=1 Tax=Actinacidiphila glaucinigra TaxID=235986 RepID=UPI00366FDA90
MSVAEDLGADTNPTTPASLSVLGDPVIEAASLNETGGKTAPGTSAHASRSQEATGHGGEVTTGADHPRLRRSSLMKRRGVKASQYGDQLVTGRMFFSAIRL